MISSDAWTREPDQLGRLGARWITENSSANRLATLS
jgi:hypothetical protein